MRTATLAVLATFGFAFLQTVHGHASLVSSNPQDGEHLSEAPSQVVLVFSEAVRLTTVRLQDGGGGEHRVEALPTELLERFAVPVHVRTAKEPSPSRGARSARTGTWSMGRLSSRFIRPPSTGPRR
jgi:methionine-rich copper-binding protein CopC